MKKTSKQAAPKDIEALRAALNSRLSALEEALTNPSKHASLESIILDLARVATEEADATVRQAVRDAQREGQTAMSSARDAAESALEAEKALSASLRAAVEKAQVELNEQRRVADTAARADAQREMESLREKVEQEQTSRAAVRRELEAALAAADSERARAAALEMAVEQVRGEAQASRAVVDAQQREIAAKLQEFAARHQGTDQQLKDAQTAQAAVRAELELARAAAETERAVAAQLRDASAQLERDLEWVRGELAGARHEIDALRRDADTRTQASATSESDQNQLVFLAQDAARAADARTEEVLRERDALQKELEAAQEAIRERDILRQELQTAHDERDAVRAMQAAPQIVVEGDEDEETVETVIDLTVDTRDEERQRAIEGRIRTLEFALRDAETRAEIAELELGQQRLLSTPRSDAFSSESPANQPASDHKEPAYRGPARGAKRVAISTEVEVQIDGTEGKLIDLSVTGAQVLTPFSMKPNRLVKLTLPMGDSLIACKAKVMWSRLEPKAGQLWYRGGVSFTGADQFALEAFLSSHTKDA